MTFEVKPFEARHRVMGFRSRERSWRRRFACEADFEGKSLGGPDPPKGAVSRSRRACREGQRSATQRSVWPHSLLCGVNFLEGPVGV